MKTQRAADLEFLAGGKAATYKGKCPVYRNYNYGTNLNYALEVFAVAETLEAAKKIVDALNAINLLKKCASLAGGK
jgi:hypothetical protein